MDLENKLMQETIYDTVRSFVIQSTITKFQKFKKV